MHVDLEEGEVLLLEDQALIAIYVEELLEQEGCGPIVTVTSCADALAWLVDHHPRLAVIETRVQDGDSTEIAEILTQRRIPFIVHTSRTKEAGDTGPDVPQVVRLWLSKPCPPEDFLDAIRACRTAVA
ncbi:response regulator [Rhizobium sp. SAFR-030]|uniref:response regulator n=1 Tax=Rhizobium sp. SAFR-030 TaxID=3387277 RepID=UPI003F7E8DB3